MKLFEITKNQKKKWDRFVLENGGSFLQSWQWGEFKKAMGHKVIRLVAIADDQQLITNHWLGVAQVIKMPLGLERSYFYVARGPVLKRQEAKGKGQRDILKALIDYLSDLTQREKVFFLRIELERTAENDQRTKETLKTLGFRRLNRGVQPENTLILDISQSEKKLFKDLRKRARYNINRAKRFKIIDCRFKIEDLEFDKAFNEFWQLMRKTAQRQKIKVYPRQYFEKLFKSLEDKAQLFIAYYQKRPIVANIVIFWGKRATYLYGASDDPSRTGAAYFIQWQQILEAKKKNLTEYDFWGIAIADKKGKVRPPKWQGITFFKRAFDGKIVKYLGGFDYPFDQKWYLFYKLANCMGLRRLIKSLRA